MVKTKKEFFWSPWGYTKRDFKKWGKEGGRPKKYVSNAERQKAYRRRRALAKLASGERVGILNLTTGRINKVKRSKKVLGQKKQPRKLKRKNEKKVEIFF